MTLLELIELMKLPTESETMTALDDLVKAAAEELYRAGFIGDRKEIAQIAATAVLRALPESEAVRVATTGMTNRNTLRALAQLADGIKT